MAMETLDNTDWDVLISGTGIQQSLLALALSRSDKKVLHIDRNDHYGGAEAALSLQEAESWAKKVGKDGSREGFSNAIITRRPSNDSEGPLKLSFSRSYSLALAPQLIYTESKLLPYLVSSKVYRQLEFLAMGSWWVYTIDNQDSDQQKSDGGREGHSTQERHGRLMRIPTTREDVVYSDKSIDLRSKRAVMKVLRFVMEYENQPDLWEPYSLRPFSHFLTEQFKLPPSLHDLFIAITLSLDPPHKTTTAFALPRIARHLRSTGKLGPGFSSVVPKWGGLSEIAQVGCRAGAVGGAVYVLGKGIKKIEPLPSSSEAQGAESIPVPAPDTDQPVTATYTAVLDDNETVRTTWIAGSENELEPQRQPLSESVESPTLSKSISIVSSTLATLFPNLAEGIPPPAGAVVVFPGGSLKTVEADPEHPPPLHLIIHSSDTGECPKGQSVIYATTIGSQDLITMGIERLLHMTGESETPQVLWSLRYQQCSPEHPSTTSDRAIDSQEESFVKLPSPSLDLVFDENILHTVKSAWERVLGGDAQGFLVFEDRNGMGEDEEDEDE